jgi:hypothetical protein
LNRTEGATQYLFSFEATAEETQPQPEAAPATEVALVPGTNLEEPNFMQEADIVPGTIPIPS